MILVADRFEDLELFYPYYRLLEEGFEVDVAAPSKGVVTGKYGYKFEVKMSIDEVDPDAYDGLVIPGGRAPERVRLVPKAIEIVKRLNEKGKPIAAICHGPQLLISAGVIKGRRVTCYPGIRDDVKLAGAEYVDEEVVVDGNIVTSRYPKDLPAFMREFVKLLKSK